MAAPKTPEAARIAVNALIEDRFMLQSTRIRIAEEIMNDTFPATQDATVLLGWRPQGRRRKAPVGRQGGAGVAPGRRRGGARVAPGWRQDGAGVAPG